MAATINVKPGRGHTASSRNGPKEIADETGICGVCALVVGGLLAVLAMTTETVAQDGYLIQPGDVLRVEVLEDPGLNRYGAGVT